jgi:hypothetical protein
LHTDGSLTKQHPDGRHGQKPENAGLQPPPRPAPQQDPIVAVNAVTFVQVRFD